MDWGVMCAVTAAHNRFKLPCDVFYLKLVSLCRELGGLVNRPSHFQGPKYLDIDRVKIIHNSLSRRHICWFGLGDDQERKVIVNQVWNKSVNATIFWDFFVKRQYNWNFWKFGSWNSINFSTNSFIHLRNWKTSERI